jgi:hypothetical protein
MKTIFQTLLLCIFISISNPLTAQEDKTVEITTTGTGKTKEIALHNALRSAIEQAFGVFISSKTEVLNDQLLTDQIISVSNGNIQHYDLISEMPIDDNTSFAVTVKSKVSISKLTSFIESKGIEVEFKGAVFAMNIKQQKLNEESELKAIREMAAILKNIADRSFDFEVAADGEPTASNTKADDWNIPLTITVKLNKNFENYKSYFQKTLIAIAMSEAEATNYINLNKPIYSVMLRNQTKTLDTILVKNKGKYKGVSKNYFLDTTNCIFVFQKKLNDPRFDKVRSEVFAGAYRLGRNKMKQYDAEKELKGFEKFLNYHNDGSWIDTLRLRILSNAPLYDIFYLRNNKSSIELQQLVFYFVHSIQNFVLDDGAQKRPYKSIAESIHYWCDVFKVARVKGFHNQGVGDYFTSSCIFYYNGNHQRNLAWEEVHRIKPYKEGEIRNSENVIYFANELRINNELPKVDIFQDGIEPYSREMIFIRDFLQTGELLNPIFPGLGTIQYNSNKIIQNSHDNIVLQFNQLCDKSNVVAKMKITDVKSLNELNKLNGYKIYPKR